MALGLALLAVCLSSACSAEVDGDMPSDQTEDGLRDENGTENVTANVDTFLKASDANSSDLGPADKCRIQKGSNVALKNPRIDGTHVSGQLVSAHGCGGKFGGGAKVFLFREHFSGWTAKTPAPLNIVDRSENYAASCQYEAANRSGAAINRIVLHNTEGRWTTFKSAWQSCGRIGAAHFVVLRSGQILRTIPERHIAYHAIGANRDSIGVEIESGPGFEGMTSAQEASVVALAKSLQTKYGVSKSGVTMHRLAAPGTTDCAKYIWPRDSAFTTWRDRTF